MDSLVFRHALSTTQKFLNAGTLLNYFPTYTLPVDGSSQLRWQVALTENVVGDMGEFLEPNVRIKFDALGDHRRRSIVLINIAEPNSRWNILCKTEGMSF
jgi:hypothetical protein